MKAFLPLTLCAAVGCGLMAGLFFAFSVCVMKGLGERPPQEGMAAMQSINVIILNPVFLMVFMGTSAACLWALVTALLQWKSSPALYLMSGSLFYLVGVLLITMLVNVPMNDALAAAKPQSAEGAQLWANYLVNWTMWNHVRTVSALAATISFVLAIFHSAQP